jgi:hypothetical protein
MYTSLYTTSLSLCIQVYTLHHYPYVYKSMHYIIILMYTSLYTTSLSLGIQVYALHHYPYVYKSIHYIIILMYTSLCTTSLSLCSSLNTAQCCSDVCKPKHCTALSRSIQVQTIHHVSLCVQV